MDWLKENWMMIAGVVVVVVVVSMIASGGSGIDLDWSQFNQGE